MLPLSFWKIHKSICKQCVNKYYIKYNRYNVPFHNYLVYSMLPYMMRNTNGKGVSLKDHLFNEEKVQFLAGLFCNVDTTFKMDLFVTEVMKELPRLELKQRIVCIAKALEQHLPKDFKKACGVIIDVLPEALDPSKTDDDFGDFIFAPLGEYVVRNGLTKKHLNTSLKTLKEITKRFSMEDSIRYFLNEFESETMKEMERWVHDNNYHVRRLVSEGTRPLLPWSGRVALEVTAPLLFLNILHADNTRYVTRSVANHMNDISKTKPDVVITSLIGWKIQERQSEKELDWVTRHSLRTLLKQGHKGALELLGYYTNPKITVSTIAVNRDSLKIGDILEFSFTVKASRDEKLMIDYVIDFVKANGQTNSKVFKLKKIEIKKGKTVVISKKHRLLAHATTFKLYPGKHAIALQINGQQYNQTTFTLT